MRYNKIGIDVDSIDKLVLDIYNYADKISKTLNQISEVVDRTKSFYVSSASNDFRNKFNSFSANFPTINKNIVSYADDLIKLKNRYQTIDEDLTQTVRKAMLKIEDTRR